MYKRFLCALDNDLSAHAAIFGYIFGLIFSLFTSDGDLFADIPSITSSFLEKDGILLFIQAVSDQTVYAALIFFTGFIPYSSFLSAVILFVRAALASYSSFLIALRSDSKALYLLHTLSGCLIICALWAISKCAYRHLHSENSLESSEKNSLSYLFEFLFFAGVIFILMFFRNIALAFV